MNEELTLMADYTSGSDNFATIGASYQFSDGFGIMAGVILPNSHGENTGFTVHFAFNGPCRHAQREE